MNEESIRIAKEIAKRNPTTILIWGNTDPTYSNTYFFEILMISSLNPERMITMGHHRKTSIWEDRVDLWVIDTIKMIQHNYEIVKFHDMYVVGKYSIENPPYYSEEHGVSIDCGGNIEVKSLNF